MKPGSTSSLNPYARSYVPVSKRAVSNGKDGVNHAGAEANGPKDGPVGHGGRSGSRYVAEDSKVTGHGDNAAEVTEKAGDNVDSEMDMAYMQMTFPGVADEFLSEIYSVSHGDLDSAIDMVKQLVLPETLDIGDVPESGSGPESNGARVKSVNGGGASSSGGSAA